MAQQFVAQNGQVLTIPGTYVDTQVQSNQAGIPIAGVVTLIGEANEGPAFSAEADLSRVAYTPDQMAQVMQKFGSGKLVDAFRAISAAANDPNITGSVSVVRLIKTNQSVAASDTHSRSGFGAYAELQARKAGVNGNLIRYRNLVSQAESAPSTGQFAYAPLVSGSQAFNVRLNGNAPKNVTATAKLAPNALVSAIEDLPLGIHAKGGQKKLPIPAAGLTLTATSPAANTLVVTLQVGQLWANNPQVGDTAVIPAAASEYGAAGASAIVGGSNQNDASFIVTAVTNTVSSATLTLRRITAGTSAAASGVSAADLHDIVLYQPIEIKNLTGQDRGSTVGIVGTYNCTSNDGLNVTIQTPTGEVWAAKPKVGDIVKIETTFANVNAGWYQVVAATDNTVDLVRLSEGSAGTTGSQVVSTPPTLATQPIKMAKPDIDGLGKSLAIVGNVNTIFRDKNTTLSAGLANSFIVSAAELKMQTQITQNSNTQSYTAGGDIVIQIGSTAADADVQVLADRIDFRENAVVKFSAPFSQFKTMADLAAFVSSQSKWSAIVTSARFQTLLPSSLDKGTFGATGLASVKAARIKRDAAAWSALVNESPLVSVDMDANSGLPEVMDAAKFLSGGAKGSTTAADVVAAVDAVEELDTNFVVPLFSQDASADIIDGETESGSTYTIDAINAYVKSHVLEMSQYKRRKNRIAIVSKLGTLEQVVEAAGQMSSYRVGLAFQTVKNTSLDGTIKDYQPWMAAVIAAGMQAAAGYKGIVKKIANISGAVQAAGDFNANNPGQVEQGLKDGLLILERINTGGFRWVSDQMTYSVDANFVYNSLQAVYVADLMALALIDRFDRAVVGKSVAEITAAGGLAILESEMFNFLRLRWTAPSDDAPKGYRNASVRLTGGVMEVNVEAKIAGLIYFVPISLTLSQVTQEASQ
jgi:hypothetical protein